MGDALGIDLRGGAPRRKLAGDDAPPAATARRRPRRSTSCPSEPAQGRGAAGATGVMLSSVSLAGALGRAGRDGGAGVRGHTGRRSPAAGPPGGGRRARHAAWSRGAAACGDRRLVPWHHAACPEGSSPWAVLDVDAGSVSVALVRRGPRRPRAGRPAGRASPPAGDDVDLAAHLDGAVGLAAFDRGGGRARPARPRLGGAGGRATLLPRPAGRTGRPPPARPPQSTRSLSWPPPWAWRCSPAVPSGGGSMPRAWRCSGPGFSPTPLPLLGGGLGELVGRDRRGGHRGRRLLRAWSRRRGRRCARRRDRRRARRA